MLINIEDNHIIRKFFRNNERFEDIIKSFLDQQLPVLLKDKTYKIKTVDGYKYQGKTIYEFKIPLDRNTNCRVAYIHSDDAIVIFFISTVIVKQQFTKLLAKTKGVAP